MDLKPYLEGALAVSVLWLAMYYRMLIKRANEEEKRDKEKE